MKTRTNLIASASLPLMLVAALMMSCGDSGETYDDASSPQPASGAPMEDNGGDAMNSGTATTGMDANTTTAASTGDRYDATGKVDPNGNYTADWSLRPGVVLTPAQERTDAMANMNGVRATLMVELDQVRAELKDGTLDKDVAAADKARAADLAQGLQRIDLALAKMGEATDISWNEMRTAQMKEVSDVRVWWNAHVEQREAMAKS